LTTNHQRLPLRQYGLMGKTEEGKKFTIVANWDEWDDWTADSSDLMWDGDEGTEEESQEIIHDFLNEMNS